MDITTTHPRIFGVDFSGAAQAGRKIWIAGGREAAGRLVVDHCCRVAELPHGGRDRGAAYRGLRRLIKHHLDAIFGIDVPFGVPAQFIQSAGWEGFVTQFEQQFPCSVDFRAHCRTGPDGKEARRVTDSHPRTPFAPANLRLYRQTYHALADVLAPLVRVDAVRVLPMQAPAVGNPVLIEICPAITVRTLGRFGPYKGKTDGHHAQRTAMLKCLCRCGLSLNPESLADAVLADTEGDALDSIVAAWTVWRLRHRLGERPAGDWQSYRREGYVYTVKPEEIPPPWETPPRTLVYGQPPCLLCPTVDGSRQPGPPCLP